MMNQEYKIFIKKSVKFIIIFLIIDFSLGFVAQQIFFNQSSGKYARITYSLEKTSAEIIVFGSSHANRHYVPDIFEEKFNKSCYNAGVQGQGILFHSALQKIILERTRPKLIILNVDTYWLFKSETAYDRLGDLKPYYWNYHDILESILSLQSKYINFKLLFKSYQTNSTILHAIRYFFSPQIDIKGYMPFNDKMAKNINRKINNDLSIAETKQALDENFIAAFKAFIANAKNKKIPLIISVSPKYYGDDDSKNESMNVMKRIVQKEKIPWYDFSTDIHFQYKNELFHDADHLNAQGAILFTKLFAKQLKADKIFLQ